MTRDEMKVEGPLHIVCQCNKCKAEKMNIIKLAKQAGFVEYELDDGTIEAFDKRYAKFAALVAAHEREECAKVCAEDSVQAMDFTGGTFVGGYFAKKIMERNKS